MPSSRDPFANFDRMRRQIDELFGDVWSRAGLAPNRRAVRGAAITARVGRATSVGALSVPRVWATAAAPMAVYRGTVA